VSLFARARSTNPTFTILTVCTGNICRSPMAEQYLRSGLQRAGVTPVSVESAGTMAQDGQDMPEQAQVLAQSYGLPVSRHSSRYLFEGHIAGADLVFGMAREHRRSVVSLFPRASRYSFTLREFARLAEGVVVEDLAEAAALPLTDTAERLRSAVAVVAARRGLVPPPEDAIDDDVVDPYRQDDAVFVQSGKQLVPAADVVVSLFALAASVEPSAGTSR
jgi:protein-tyrosine phosphatase